MRQTVGNAERWAAFRAKQLHLPLDLVVSDLSSLMSEGLNWSPDLARGTAKHALVWRRFFNLIEKEHACPPSCAWVPEHSSLEDAPLSDRA
eukprot:7146479-Pyramimonas_sp.AAC.1